MSKELKWNKLRPAVIGAEGYEITDMSAGNEQGWRGSFPGECVYRWFGTMEEAQTAAQDHYTLSTVKAPAEVEVPSSDKRLLAQIDYAIDLQRIIEALCGGYSIPDPRTSARHHYNMAVSYQAWL